MSETIGGNGHGNGNVYVKFADGRTQEIPVEWASYMLRDWFAKRPAQFGTVLSKAAIGAEKGN